MDGYPLISAHPLDTRRFVLSSNKEKTTYILVKKEFLKKVWKTSEKRRFRLLVDKIRFVNFRFVRQDERI